MVSLERLSAHCRTEIAQLCSTTADAYGVAEPLSATPNSYDAVDTNIVDFLSNLAVSSRMALPNFVLLVRGQTEADPRPNKGLYELPPLYDSVLHETRQCWNDVIRAGVGTTAPSSSKVSTTQSCVY
ncbi:hypothetical protein JG688_00016739 [Phytophthora aleatoria]|uniref:Uncharacterized protein n=1 Tax=Phytophthora aleatoria TaxID=2496075 RepID=A0A8J5LVZ1_9STRA|nr:hypothetical protein JG688_00016739 [Phytophthora aleatoria]